MRLRSCIVATVLLAGSQTLAPTPARAQQEVQVASTAFAEGQQAQLRGDFVRAAELFEIADAAVPSAAAIRSAIRTRGAAGHEVRAATLALQALQRYPDDAETRAVAEGTLDRLAPKLTRIRLHCSEPCTATLNGALIGSGPLVTMEFFVPPGRHVVKGAWPGRPPISEALVTEVGQALEVELTAPAKAPTLPPAAPPPLKVSEKPLPPPPVQPEPSSAELELLAKPIDTGSNGGWSPAVFWTGAALTAVGGALIWWSGSETLNERDEYERNPTRQGYEDGVDLERRTNLLIAGTAVMGAATLAVGVFATDWGGRSRVGVKLTPQRAMISMTGALP